MVTARQSQRPSRNDIVWQAIEKYDEQRRYPRITLDLPIVFKTEQGQNRPAKLINISPDGACARSNIATARMLHPRGGHVSPNNSPIVEMQALLPLAGRSKVFSVCARLVYLVTVTEEPRCIIGLRFLEPRPDAKRILDRFFAEQMQVP